MSALPKSHFKEIDTSWKSQLAQRNSSTDSLVRSPKKSRTKTAKLSSKKRSSATLQLLKLLEKSSSVLAVVTISGSIAVYLATVTIPQQWSREYENLETLQRKERKLVALDEALKYEIAQQAQQSDLEMSAIAPESTMFLEKASVEPVKIAASIKELPSVRMGY